MWTLYLSALFLSVVQIQHVLSTGCQIVSVSSPSASSLHVAWSAYAGATYYQLDSRIVNSTTTAPVTVEVSTSYTQKQIQGLRPGNVYQVTLNVFVFFSIVCTDVKITMTVPDTPQFISAEAVSSTSVKFEWNNVTGADSVLLFVEQYDSPSTKYSKTFTTWRGEMDGLEPSTTYNCYIFSINSAGQSDMSATKTVMTLVQPPPEVNVTSTGKSTVHVTWASVSDVLLYAVTVTDTDNPSNSPVIINTSGTSKDISNLEPCSTYTIGVSSLNIFLVPGEPTSVSHTTSNINQVTTISVDYSCTGSLVTVSWDLVFGANSYRATAVDGTGASLNCTSASTSCQIDMLSCGETYQVRVAAISDDCTSVSNTLTTFETTPCAPANVQTDHACSTNVIIFSWDHTNKTSYYEATSVDTNGVTSACLTVNNNCYFTNVECGQMYTFTVFAVSPECNSNVSQPKTVQTSPCRPENVQTSYQCLSDKLITAWDFADGADSYTVEIKGNTDETYNCTTTSDSCEITGMPCGEHFSVWISASNEMCTTPEELAEIAQTAPCTPQNASASVDCSQDSARVNWTTSTGAIYYIVIAQESNGNIHGCFSMGSNCLINTLTCGNNYTGKVIATNIECNSTNNEEFTFSTAPCAPATIQALRSCDENLARIEWQNHQPNGIYTATIEDQSGAQLTCTNDTVNYCTFSSLPCGKTYSVTVTYSEGNCESTSTPISMDSVPCGPEDVIASVACDTEELTLTWNISLPADNFTAVIARATGPALQCNSTGTQCTTGGLLCGSSYSVTVSSTTGMCSSRPSTEVTVQTWPCPPTNVTVTQTCSSAPVPVSWTASDGAKYYTVVATSSGGHSTDCSTNQTSCSLAGLQCGEVYTIGVSGADDNCTGQLSNTVSLDTEPCTPTNVSSQLMCDAGTADVFWTPAANAVSYNVTATTSNGQTLTCSGSSANCTLSNLVCDHAYDIRVTATDGMCVSSHSAVFSQDPVPCAPQNISMNLLCGTNDLTVSWVPSLNPLNYTVTALPLSGSAETFYTSNASLSLSGLQCGGTYNLTIRASSGSCSGAYSAPQTVQTAPCPPQSLTAEAQCGTNALLASWNASLGATTYTATVTGPEGFSDSCSSSSLTCSVFGLQCSSQYNVTLTSQDGNCTSTPIQTVLTTGPCDPANVTSSLHCGSDMATVSWVASAGAVAYSIVAQDTSSQSSTSCRSSTTSCQLGQLQCGRVYNLTVVAEDASCNSTGNTEAVLMTAACAPAIHNSTNICGASSSSLSWESMADAVGYTVNATATSGHQVSCSSATATCTLTNLQCSETYTATVVAQGSQCDSTPGPSSNFSTEPCSPSVTSKHYTCNTSTAVFSWTNPAGSLGFVAHIAGEGYEDNCDTTDTSCVFHNLPCDLCLNITVQAQGSQCSSLPSVIESMETVPCIPQNVSATLGCLNHSASVTWAGSPSAIGYNVTLTSLDGHTHHCHSDTSSCDVPDIHCGETYSITVTPFSMTCTGNQSAAYSFSSGLCPPSNVSVSPDCEDNTVSWSLVPGAEMYIATASADDGHTHTCSKNSSSTCHFTDLHCGETYSVTVQAVDRGCFSEPSSAVSLTTAPCLPENVSAEVQCNTNVMAVSWAQTTGSGDYTVWATSTDGHNVSCNSTSNSCSISGLQCGKVYEVSVTPSTAQCSVIAGSDYRVQAAPCKPENTTAEQNCSSNVMTVTWDEGNTAQNYTVTASPASGVNSTCVSTGSSCSFLDLSCGRFYTFTVMVHTNVCMSEMSTPIEKMTAPCAPTNVSANMNCTTHDALVSWSTAAGAEAYNVQANSTNGHGSSSCSVAGTSCSLESLVCGEEYSAVVEPLDTGCPGPVSSPVTFTTEPCVPTSLSVQYNASTAQVMWGTAGGADSYSVEAVTDPGPAVTCDTNSTSCLLTGLQCGQVYNVTVMAHNEACDSSVSGAHQLLTEPCPPTNVQANIACESLTATVSWDQSALAVGYVAYVDGQSGHNTSCVATNTQCTVSGVTCGAAYDVWVKALGQVYNSSDSTVASLTSGPCQPSSIDAVMNCEARFATISWQLSVGAVSYAAELASTSGHATGCTTNHTHCELSSLQCGEEYNVTVMALGESCNSSAQMAGHLTTEPCVPTNLSTSHYNATTAQVMWSAASGASYYCVEAVTDQGPLASCNTTTTSCILTGLQCSQVYNVTVMAQNWACNNTSTSESHHITTEPCPPTNVQASMVCEQLTATVSWDQSALAVGYEAYVDNQSGQCISCAATNTQCTVSGLTCGTVYNVWVKALGQEYNSSDSTIVHLTSAPCLPGDIVAVANCNSDGAANVSWNTISGAANFSLSAFVSGSLQTLCTTQENSCNVTNLACGETYNLNITASNEECSLTAMMPTNITTRPCPPQGVTADLGCGSSTAVLSWTGTSDVELYKATAIKASGGEVKKCNSTGSTCHFPSLVCGETYNFTVTALSQDCCSQASSTVSLQTEPCQPVITSVQTLCQSEQVQISWGQTSGVVNYAITVRGNLEFVNDYNTTGTILSVPLPCGQHYNVTVQGQGYVCESIPSSPAFFKTGPCIPQNVTTYMQCELNQGSVSWDPSDGAETYVAEATGLDGHDHQCPTNTTSCTWDDLHCGESYTVVVRATDDNCTSLPSSSAVICMDPCVPENVIASADCNMGVVSLTWSASNGSETYHVTAEAENTTTQLTTNATTVDFFNLACGQDYNLTVTPHSNHCAGSSSEQAFIQTWPCAPSEISILHNCLAHFAVVLWQEGNGSDSHTVSMQSDSGVSTTAVSAGSHLNVTDLDCGYNFSVSVTAYNQQCNATSSENKFLQSAPCVPTNVTVVRDCVNNTALVSWSASRGALQYSVTAHCSNGTVSCQTSDLSYNLDNLACGSSYTIQVLAMDDSCSSAPSLEVMLDSAPCPPQNVSAQFSCSSNDMTVSWDAVGEADHFLVSASADNGGISESCNTTNTWCSFSNVSCGKTFTVHVTSVRGNCHSQPSQACSILSAPCQPQGVSGNIDCVTNSAWISWSAALGADSYTVSAVGGENYTANCTTSSNTTCEVEDLACGVHYDFNVTAENSQCESQPSATISLHTAPCSLSAITAFPQCHSSSILVVWELMEGSVGNTVYIATAKASDNTTLSCNDTGVSCYLHGAQCDLRYTIIVAASSDQCSSMRSPPYRINMEPCPPQNMSLSSSCEEQSVMVSWTPSPVAEAYSVVAVAADAHVHTCNTTSSSNCSLSALHCDQQYTVFVTASHENCSSEASENTTLTTGPCPPSGVSVTFHCNNESAELSWIPGVSAVEYYGCAQAENGDMLYCYSTSLACTIEGLDCGEVYNFTVQASDGTCNSSFSDPVQQGAVPCPPDGVEVQVTPMQMEAQALIFSWNQGSCNNSWYLVTLTGSLLGDSTALFQILSYWTNSLYFEIPLPCGSSYNATVQSRNSAGTSDPSETLGGLTAPCPPTNARYSSGPVTSIEWDASVFASAYTVYDNSATPWIQMCRVSGLSCTLSNITSSNLIITASNAAGESEVSIIILEP